MTAQEYLEQRVDDQIQWFDRKSVTAQRVYKQIRYAEILFAATIPFLAGITTRHPVVPVITGLLGAVVVVLAAIQHLGQHHEHWLEYRATCEVLKQEKYRFLAGSGMYSGENPLALFVERVEGLLAKETAAWVRFAQERARPDGAAPSE